MTATRIILEATDKTGPAFASAKSGLAGVGSAASTANRLLAGFGVGLSVAGLTAFITKGINASAALADLSIRTSVAVRDLAGLSVVAKQSDTSIEELARGINKLGIYMTENADAAKKLGLTAKDPLEAFIQLSGVLSGVTDVQLRNTIANKALGRGYAELLPALLQGNEALRKQIEAGKDANRITDEMAKEAKKFRDELALLGVGLTSMSATIAGPFVSSLNTLIEKFREARREGEGFWRSLVIGLKGGPIAEIENNLAFLGLRLAAAGEELSRASSESGKALVRAKIAGIESEIRVSTARLEKLMHDAFGAKPPVTAPTADTKLQESACTAVGGVWKGGKCDLGEADKGREAMLKSNAAFVKSLQEQAAMLGMSEQAATLYKASLMGLSAGQMLSIGLSAQQIADHKEYVEGIKDGIDADEKALAVKKKAQEAAAAVTKSLKEQARAIAEQLDPQLELNAALKLFGEQLASNAITQQEYNLLFDDSIDRMVKKTKTGTDDMSEFAKQAARNMQDAFADFLFDPFKDGLKGMLAGFIDMLRRMAAEEAAAQIFKKLGLSGEGGLIKAGISWLLGSAKGNVFDQSGVTAFANGGVVNSPTLFKFSRGTGLMGEAGPEAIMPLKRGADGKLGVQAEGGKSLTVVNNFTLSQPADRRTQEQIAVMAGSAVQRAMRRGA